ncbi:MAG: hypothetical protein IJS28_10470 [Synergistaceae bacterium]|nr:hypothetical protein [Synergistaceae bacterium]
MSRASRALRDDTRIIHLGLGERGRHAAISAWHYLKPGRSHEKCTDSLITLYRKVITQ